MRARDNPVDVTFDDRDGERLPGVSELENRLARALGPRYALEREIGRGGMGIVYLARDTVLERQVAIKVLRPEHATATAVERFLREARTLARLSHPHVVQVHDVIEPDGLPCIVMDHVEGPTLREVLQGGARLPVARVRAIAGQLLDALAHVHALGIVHRDLKPANIFLVADTAKLVDFGIASRSEDETLTREGQRLGTDDYMAPEQRDSARTVDGRADLYSLGLVLLEALTGQRPTTMDTRTWRNVPRRWARVLERAMRADPVERWPDAGAFRSALVKPGLRWTSGVLLTAVTATVAWLATRDWRPAPPAVDEGELAVFPTGLHAGDTLGWQLAEHVVADLEPFPLMRVVPAAATHDWWDGKPKAANAPASASRYALLELSVVRDTTQVDVRIRNARNGQLFEQFHIAAAVSDLDGLGHALADSLVRKLSERDLQDFRNFSFHPAGVEATRAFFRGKQAFQRGDWADAAREYSSALERDPRFVQAAWGLMIARRFQREPFGDALAVLLREREALPPFYRQLLDAQLEPDLVDRMHRYEALVRSTDGSGEALLHYTNELFHRGALVGRPLTPTLDTMSLLAETHRDMRHAATYDLTIWGNLRAGREDAAWRQFRRRAALVAPDDTHQRLHRFGIWARFSPWKARLVRTLVLRWQGREFLEELTKVFRLGLSMDIPEQQVAIGQLLEAKHVSRAMSATGLVGQALGSMALGRPSAAFRALDSASASMSGDEMRLQRVEWPIVLAAVGLPIDSAETSRARHVLRAGPWSGPAAARARFALGLDALSHGDSGLARAYADTLQVTPEPVSSRLGALLGARVLAARGEWLEALASGFRARFGRDPARTVRPRIDLSRPR